MDKVNSDTAPCLSGRNMTRAFFTNNKNNDNMRTADRNRLKRAVEHINAACVHINGIRGILITTEQWQHRSAIVAALLEQKRIINQLININDEYDKTHEQ